VAEVRRNRICRYIQQPFSNLHIGWVMKNAALALQDIALQEPNCTNFQLLGTGYAVYRAWGKALENDC
jgi:hypothetical protein